MANRSKQFDVVIIGGGPAGISASIWCADLGLDGILIDRANEIGGGLMRIYNPITNYPGVSAENGREMRDIFQHRLNETSVNVRLGYEVERIDAETLDVELSTGETVSGRSILFATGVRRRQLGLDGEDRFRGHGILESGARDPEAVSGMNVAVVGGGDAAAENAYLLSKFAKCVYLIHRGDKLSARDELAHEALSAPNVVFLNNTEIRELRGADELRSIEVEQDGIVRSIDVERLIFRIGVVPNSELLAGAVALDEKGYIRIDQYGRSSREGIFAVGDVASPESPTIATAVGQAASAIKLIRSLHP